MRFLPTAAQIISNEVIQARLLEKIMPNYDFDARTVTHAELLYCIDNDMQVDGVIVYSPPLTTTQINYKVPNTWPGAYWTDEEGNNTVTKTFEEYTHAEPVEGGKFCLLFTMTAKGPTGAIKYVNLLGLKTWVAKVKTVLPATDGFISPEEYEAIKVVPEPI